MSDPITLSISIILYNSAGYLTYLIMNNTNIIRK